MFDQPRLNTAAPIVTDFLTRLLQSTLPRPARRWLWTKRLQFGRALLPFRRVGGFSKLRRLTPISKDFGSSRGYCIDRYYIDKFLERNAGDIRGHVLDFQNDYYAHHYGGSKVTGVDVLHCSDGNPGATIVADITRASHIASDSFDCIICTQVLLLIYDVRAAIATLYRILKPGGVLLVTVPGVAHKIVLDDPVTEPDCWRFTSFSLRKLFEELFPPANIEIDRYGNVLASICFLHGMAAEELRPEELDFFDPEYELSIALRAVKPAGVLNAP